MYTQVATITKRLIPHQERHQCLLLRGITNYRGPSHKTMSINHICNQRASIPCKDLRGYFAFSFQNNHLLPLKRPLNYARITTFYTLKRPLNYARITTFYTLKRPLNYARITTFYTLKRPLNYARITTFHTLKRPLNYAIITSTLWKDLLTMPE